MNPLSAFLLAPFFARSLTFVPCSLLLNRAETLATQATFGKRDPTLNLSKTSICNTNE